MSQNNITFSLQQLDANGETLARRTWTSSDAAPTVGEFRQGSLVDTAQATISLPATQIRQLALRNTHASATITAVWTPTTGSSGTVLVLGPNDTIAFVNENTGATYGLSSLKLTASASGTPYELFLGG